MRNHHLQFTSIFFENHKNTEDREREKYNLDIWLRTSRCKMWPKLEIAANRSGGNLKRPFEYKLIHLGFNKLNGKNKKLYPVTNYQYSWSKPSSSIFSVDKMFQNSKRFLYAFTSNTNFLVRKIYIKNHFLFNLWDVCQK